MVLTPTYHVFEMYKGFQEATYLPTDVTVDSMKVKDNRIVPLVNTSAAKQTDGSIIVSLSNIDVDNVHEMTINLNGINAQSVTGRILTSKNVTDYNDFDNPNKVVPAEFKDAKLKKGVLTVKLPAKSIVVLNIK